MRPSVPRWCDSEPSRARTVFLSSGPLEAAPALSVVSRESPTRRPVHRHRHHGRWSRRRRCPGRRSGLGIRTNRVSLLASRIGEGGCHDILPARGCRDEEVSRGCTAREGHSLGHGRDHHSPGGSGPVSRRNHHHQGHNAAHAGPTRPARRRIRQDPGRAGQRQSSAGAATRRWCGYGLRHLMPAGDDSDLRLQVGQVRLQVARVRLRRRRPCPIRSTSGT